MDRINQTGKFGTFALPTHTLAVMSNHQSKQMTNDY